MLRALRRFANVALHDLTGVLQSLRAEDEVKADAAFTSARCHSKTYSHPAGVGRWPAIWQAISLPHVITRGYLRSVHLVGRPGADRLLVIGESARAQRLVKESAVVRHTGNQLVIVIDLQLPEQFMKGAIAYLQAILIAHSDPNGGTAADGVGVLPHQLEGI